MWRDVMRRDAMCLDVTWCDVIQCDAMVYVSLEFRDTSICLNIKRVVQIDTKWQNNANYNFEFDTIHWW